LTLVGITLGSMTSTVKVTEVVVLAGTKSGALVRIPIISVVELVVAMAPLEVADVAVVVAVLACVMEDFDLSDADGCCA
jgi:hypothetical protein